MPSFRHSSSFKTLLSGIFYALTGMIGLFAALPSQAQDAKSIMQKMISTYQGMSSYEGSANADEQRRTSDDKILMEAAVSVKLFFKRPNKVKLDFSIPTGGQTVYSDGARITAYAEKPNSYSSVDSAPTAQKMVVQLQRVRVQSAFDTLYFLCIGQLPPTMTNLTLKGAETVNGRPSYVVEAKMHIPSRVFTGPKGQQIKMAEENSIWKWWIDKETSLLKRIEARVPNVPQTVYVVEKKKRVQKVIHITVYRHQTILDPKVNPPLDDKLFVFTPPPGSIDTTKNTEKLLHGK